MKLELLDPDAPEAMRIWRALEAQWPASYFLSAGWVENWLACLPRAHAPSLAVIRDGAGPVAACWLGRRLLVRHRVVPTRAVFLNATGVPRLDDVWIEYNGLLGRPLALAEVLAVLPRGWDELFLPALDGQAFADLRASHASVKIRFEREVPAYHVDLARTRATGYLAQLSGQTRSQVRRAQRDAGACSVELARDPREAIEIYSELCALHTAQWRAKGKPGAFADPWFERFHRQLIARRFAHGEIQLLRVRGAPGTLGCLYNFVHRGRVLQYQSGMASFENPHLKPGFVCHAAAIAHAASAGLAVYDFLGGDVRYKKSLSTERSTLLWARVQRPRVRFFIEDHVRNWRDRRARARAQT